MSAEQMKLANLEGRDSQPGALNPYAGQDRTLARAWMLGHKTMLLARLRSAQPQ